MHKIFVPIFHFFNKHKILMYLIMVISFLVFLFFGLRLHFEEDISKLLPTSSVESQLAFSSIQLKDKIYIQVTSAEEPVSPNILAERTDEFINLLYEKDSTSHYIGNVLYKMDPTLALNALDLLFFSFSSRPKRTSWLIVGMVTSCFPELCGSLFLSFYM